MSYKTRNQKIITLPSGATVSIRKLVPEDYLSQKSIPVYDMVGGRNKPENLSPEQMAVIEERDRQRGIQMRKTILTRCCGPLQFEGESLRIVDKPSTETSTAEIAIELLDIDDSKFIADQVIEMSGLLAGPEVPARTFPNEQQGSGEGAPAGEVIRLPSNGDSQVANG